MKGAVPKSVVFTGMAPGSVPAVEVTYYLEALRDADPEWLALLFAEHSERGIEVPVDLINALKSGGEP